jgi:hypothetical protein
VGCWLGALDRRKRRIAMLLATGETTRAAARKFGIPEPQPHWGSAGRSSGPCSQRMKEPG